MSTLLHKISCLLGLGRTDEEPKNKEPQKDISKEAYPERLKDHQATSVNTNQSDRLKDSAQKEEPRVVRVFTKEEEDFKEVQKHGDVKELIPFALKGYVRDETDKIRPDLKSDEDYKAMLDMLEKEDPDSTSPEIFLQIVELHWMRYSFHNKNNEAQSMLSVLSSLAYVCVQYGYYDDAIQLAKMHDGSCWLAPMGWSGDLEEYILLAIEKRKKDKEKKEQQSEPDYPG